MLRESKYTPALGARICAAVAAGKSLRTICAADDMPDWLTVLTWLTDGKHPEFATQYERARQELADTLTDEITAIADAADGKTSAEVSAAKLRIDARKWVVGTLRTAQPASGKDAAPDDPKVDLAEALRQARSRRRNHGEKKQD